MVIFPTCSLESFRSFRKRYSIFRFVCVVFLGGSLAGKPKRLACERHNHISYPRYFVEISVMRAARSEEVL